MTFTKKSHKSNPSIECRSCCRRKKSLTLGRKKMIVCLTKSNQMHPLNIVAAVAKKDVDSLEEKKIVVCA